MGEELKVTLVGQDLDEIRELQFSHSGIVATVVAANDEDKKQPGNPEFTVKIGADVPVGTYEVRAVGRYGMSNPRAFHVGQLPEITKSGKINQRTSAMQVTVPITINGQVETENVDYFTFAAKAGQRLLVDCRAQRIDSRMDATLILLNESGQEIARVRDTEAHDPVLDIVVEQDGQYTVGVFDFVYGGGAEYFYRLQIHTGPRVDFVFPPVGTPGATAKHTIYGRNLPGGEKVSADEVGGQPMEKLTVDIAMPDDEKTRQGLEIGSLAAPHSAPVDGKAFRIDSPSGPSNAVTIGFATAPVVVEAEANNDPASAQSVSLPCEYVGRFFPQGDRDWVRFSAKKGDVLWIEVLSHQLGAASDPMLIIEQIKKNNEGVETGSAVAEVDDPARQNNQPSPLSTETKDPSYRLEVKEDGDYRVLVYDVLDNPESDPRLVYRLLIRPQQEDFRLAAFAPMAATGNNNSQVDISSVVLRRGGAAGIDLRAFRRNGFEGEINITAEGLPAGVSCPEVTISAKEDRATLVLSAEENASAWAGPFQIVGRAKVGDQELVRSARAGSLVWGSKNMQEEVPSARLTRDLGMAVIDAESAPATVTLGDGNMIEMEPGAKIELPIKVARRGDFKDALKLSVTGLPKEVKVGDVNVAGEEGKVEIDLSKIKMPEGTYTIILKGTAKMKYARDEKDKPKDINVEVLSTPARIRVAAK